MKISGCRTVVLSVVSPVISPAARLCDGVCQPCLSTTSKRSIGPERALSAVGSSEQAEGSSMAVAAAAARRLSNEKMEPCDFILDRIFSQKEFIPGRDAPRRRRSRRLRGVPAAISDCQDAATGAKGKSQGSPSGRYRSLIQRTRELTILGYWQLVSPLSNTTYHALLLSELDSVADQ